MITAHTQQQLSQALAGLSRPQGKLGFVPTMGALHQGHLSLIANCLQVCGNAVASVFVNRGQFNQPSDYDRYPRMPEQDTQMLSQAGCSLLFLPDETAVYPRPEMRRPRFVFGPLAQVLEGKFRPGHFESVLAVVDRLFQLVQPTHAFFGLKDYQQYLLIRQMAGALHPAVEVVGCPTAREPDGLAMSSRNMLLSKEERHQASAIFRAMQAAAESAKAMPDKLAQIAAQGSARLAEGNFKVEYFDICSAETLRPPIAGEKNLIVVVAAWLGNVRLIDNLLFSL